MRDTQGARSAFRDDAERRDGMERERNRVKPDPLAGSPRRIWRITRNYAARIQTISTAQRQKKLTCRPILEFVTLVYVYKKVVSSNIQMHGIKKIKALFFTRFLKNWRYFISNDLLKSNYRFVREIVKHI